jgi:ribosomal protein S18 acetylase RimI-like enzyme
MKSILVRTASRDDIDDLSAMLARAFDDDPVMCFLLPSRRRHDLHARRFFAWQLRRLISQEQVHVAADGLGAAIWALPGTWRESPREALGLAIRTLPAVMLHLPRVAASIAMIEARHPRKPHMYLSVLGTEPRAQGQGVGSAAIVPGLALADAEGLPAYLESSKERNLDFYARFGFEVMDELRLPGSGPPLWPMWRASAAERVSAEPVG